MEIRSYPYPLKISLTAVDGSLIVKLTYQAPEYNPINAVIEELPANYHGGSGRTVIAKNRGKIQFSYIDGWNILIIRFPLKMELANPVSKEITLVIERPHLQEDVILDYYKWKRSVVGKERNLTIDEDDLVFEILSNILRHTNIRRDIFYQEGVENMIIRLGDYTFKIAGITKLADLYEIAEIVSEDRKDSTQCLSINVEMDQKTKSFTISGYNISNIEKTHNLKFIFS